MAVRDKLKTLPVPSPRNSATPRIPSVEGYVIYGLIGRGSMGAVYLGHDENLNRPVAVKVLAPSVSRHREARERFFREARAMARVNHPGVVGVYAFGEADGHVYLIMEHVDGVTLTEQIKKRGQLVAAEALPIARQVADALEAAWEQGVVHRDIKPSNILIDAEGRARVVDFGLARTVKFDPDSTLTQPGTPVGTPHYISPERAQGGTVDFRNDVYSLGIVLFEMLTGATPYQGTTAAEILGKQMHAPLPPMTAFGVHPEVVKFVEWLTRKAPEERPADYASLRKRIDDLLMESSGVRNSFARFISYFGS